MIRPPAPRAAAHRRALLALVPLALLLPAAAPDAAATLAPVPRILYLDPDAKPAETGLIRRLTAFDCAGLDTLTLAAGTFGTSGTVINGDTTGGPSLLPAYGCRAWSEHGPEHVYRLEVTEDLQLWAGLSNLGAIDLDLFLLDGCDSDACLAGANTEIGALLTVGTYWLVVDGYGAAPGAAGPYTLTIDTRWPGVPPQVCEPGGAVEVACAGATIPVVGDLLGTANLLQAYDCSPSQVRGGEIWYAVTLPALHAVTARATPATFATTLDLVLWLFDGCSASAVCVDYADDKAGGQDESVVFDNTGAGPVTVYLAVDTVRTPTDAGAAQFTLDFICQDIVATEPSSLGSVRALFR